MTDVLDGRDIRDCVEACQGEARGREEALRVVRRGGRLEVGGRAVEGDVVALEAGDKVPADAVFVRGNDVQCDESALTGETDDLFKDASGEAGSEGNTSGDESGEEGASGKEARTSEQSERCS